ncbi:MAG TPA: CapA family protein [Candidatus Limiplasma sp.]|nr:CapA family protein [Candidatus Limiplasma sp.]HRX09807.1 CapA family protein [Candidatus Limiplasma sp.]
MLRKLTAVMLSLCLLLPALALATQTEEDSDVSLEDALIQAGVISVTITNEDGETVSDETIEVADTTQPRYEVDGSIELTMTFGGDFTIGDNVQASGKSMFEKELDQQDRDLNFMFRNVRDILQADDLTVLNFEGTLTTASRNRYRADYKFLFRADPSYVSMLADNSVEFVTLENNHVMDMGEEGFAETKRVLTDAGVGHASDGEPALFTLYGAKVGILAYQTFDGAYDRLFTQVPEDIAALKGQGADLVICGFHWGDELDYYPNSNQQKLAKIAVDGGADLVVGHHSHRINPIELYKGKYIVYSLANFVFAGNTKPSDMSTFIFQIKFRIKDGEVSTPDGFIIIPARISSNTNDNDMIITPYTKRENIDSVISVMQKNGDHLENPVPEYPTSWSR